MPVLIDLKKSLQLTPASWDVRSDNSLSNASDNRSITRQNFASHQHLKVVFGAKIDPMQQRDNWVDWTTVVFKSFNKFQIVFTWNFKAEFVSWVSVDCCNQM